MLENKARHFLNDERLKQAQQTIVATLKEHQGGLTKVRPPLTDNKVEYENIIKEFSQKRGGNLAFPYLSSGLGNGPFVELADGSVKYDFIIGIGVHFLGHSHAGLTSAILMASLADTVMQGNLQQNLESFEFSRTLLGAANAKGASLDHCFLTSTGVMAGENALKMCFQKKDPATRVICLHKCFMGRTLFMSQTTDNPAYRQGLPAIAEVDYVPHFDATRPKESIAESVNALQELIKKYPEQHAAMCFELVLGEGGFYPGSPEFFKALMTLCQDNNIPVLVDEVQTFARTSELFAFQHFGLDKYIDAVWIGKASQVCATLYREHLKAKPGLLSQTYTASSTAIAAGNYILNYLLSGNYYGPEGKIETLHNYFVTQLKIIESQHPKLITGPFGTGAMVAFTPFGGDADKVKAFVHKLFHNGLMSFICGGIPKRVRFLVPAGATEPHHIDEVCQIIEKTLIEMDS